MPLALHRERERDASSPMPETPHEDAQELAPLLEDLTRRRLESKNTPNPIHQTVIAERLGTTAGTISRLENGRMSLRKQSGEFVYAMLQGYGYTPSQIKTAVERFRLNRPPQYPESEQEHPPGKVTVMREGTISRPASPQPVRMDDRTNGRYDPEYLRVRSVAPSDLATEKAREKLEIGTDIWLHTNARPLPGNFVIVRQDKREALCVWPFTAPVYALPLDPSENVNPIRLDPERVEVVRVVAALAYQFELDTQP